MAEEQTILNKLGAFSKKYAIIISLVVYFGIDKGAMQLFKDTEIALKNPKEMAKKYKADSLRFSENIRVLKMRLDKLEQRVKIDEEKEEHLMVGMSIMADCLGEEMDIEHIWGNQVLATNPRNFWVIKEDKFGIRTPLSLQPDYHYKQFYYQPIGNTTKIPLK